MGKYNPNDIIIGTVTGIEPYGIFVTFEDNYSGLVHISEISEKFVKNVGDFVLLEEKIKVEVLAVDEENHHLKLSIKNIDYRINKQKEVKIKETPLGFTTLKKNLDNWITKKKEELAEKSSKNG